jgi:hypothetical protein
MSTHAAKFHHLFHRNAKRRVHAWRRACLIAALAAALFAGLSSAENASEQQSVFGDLPHGYATR